MRENEQKCVSYFSKMFFVHQGNEKNYNIITNFL